MFVHLIDATGSGDANLGGRSYLLAPGVTEADLTLDELQTYHAAKQFERWRAEMEAKGRKCPHDTITCTAPGTACPHWQGTFCEKEESQG